MYKISELDEALRSILGKDIADAMLNSKSMFRPMICEIAGSKCFKYQLSGPYVNILREALLDLDIHGSFKNAEWDVD